MEQRGNDEILEELMKPNREEVVPKEMDDLELAKHW